MKSLKNKEVIKKKEALKWYVDFANMDLETIKPGDKAKLLIESEEYLYPKEEVDELKKPKPHSYREFIYEILRKDLPQEKVESAARIVMEQSPDEPMSQEETKTLEWAFQDVSSIKESAEYWKKISILQKLIQVYFKLFSMSTKLLNDVRRVENMMIRISWNKNQPFTISYFPITESQPNYINFRIFRLLEGFPGHAISICPVCNKVFLNTTFRKKEFCSPNCMWKNNSAKQRKKDPEKYRKYQRELMRKKSIKEKGLDNQKIKEPKRKSK